MARTLPVLAMVLCCLALVGAQRTTSPGPAPASGAGNTTAGKGLTAVAGVKVGHFTLSERPTGCTVIVVDGAGATGGVSQRGGAPGTRETDLLDPLNMVDRVNAIVLSGGSAYGLDAAQGAVRFLEEKGVGWRVGAAGVVPIVPAAILFDLGFGGSAKIRPTAECGYKAAGAATDGAVQEGNVGAGAGATVGKMGGGAMKAGVGSAARVMPNGLVVAAIVAVNAAGDVIDPETGRVVAGARSRDGRTLADVRQLLRSGALSQAAPPPAGRNTTIAVVATNARLDKAQASRMALMADDGLARAIAPSHTLGDGDTVFSLATGRFTGDANISVIGALAADALAEAIVRAAVFARSSGGLPAARDLGSVPERYRSAIGAR
jgi:L-aminopeptidase/D-esterase-like protein